MTTHSPASPIGTRPWSALALTYALWTLRTTWRNGEQLLLVVGIPLIALLALTRTDLISGAGAPVAVVAAMIVLGTGFTSPAISVAFDRRYGSYAFLGTTPLPRSAIIVGSLAAICVSALLSLGVVLTVGAATGLVPSIGQATAVVLAVLTGLCSVVPWALALGGTARSETVLVIANAVFVAAILFGGVLIPANSLPFGAILEWLPPATIVALATTPTALGLGVCAGWMLIGAALAVRTFRWR